MIKKLELTNAETAIVKNAIEPYFELKSDGRKVCILKEAKQLKGMNPNVLFLVLANASPQTSAMLFAQAKQTLAFSHLISFMQERVLSDTAALSEAFKAANEQSPPNTGLNFSLLDILKHDDALITLPPENFVNVLEFIKNKITASNNPKEITTLIEKFSTLLKKYIDKENYREDRDRNSHIKLLEQLLTKKMFESGEIYLADDLIRHYFEINLFFGASGIQGDDLWKAFYETCVNTALHERCEISDELKGFIEYRKAEYTKDSIFNTKISQFLDSPEQYKKLMPFLTIKDGKFVYHLQPRRILPNPNDCFLAISDIARLAKTDWVAANYLKTLFSNDTGDLTDPITLRFAMTKNGLLTLKELVDLRPDGVTNWNSMITKFVLAPENYATLHPQFKTLVKERPEIAHTVIAVSKSESIGQKVMNFFAKLISPIWKTDRFRQMQNVSAALSWAEPEIKVRGHTPTMMSALDDAANASSSEPALASAATPAQGDSTSTAVAAAVPDSHSFPPKKLTEADYKKIRAAQLAKEAAQKAPEINPSLAKR